MNSARCGYIIEPPVPRRPGGLAQSQSRRVDGLLRPVLPVGHVSPPDPCQHLPETLGREEVPTCAPTTGSGDGGRDCSIDSPTSSPTGNGSAGPHQADEKSRITGDCHPNEAARMRRPASRVSFLMCPFCVRGWLLSQTTESRSMVKTSLAVRTRPCPTQRTHPAGSSHPGGRPSRRPRSRYICVAGDRPE